LVALLGGSERMPRLFFECPAAHARGPTRRAGRGSRPPGWRAAGWHPPSNGASIP
jgi:hypothetical protein